MENFCLHVALDVVDMQNCIDFYEKALGYKEVKRFENNGIITNMFLSDGGHFGIELVQVEEPSDKSNVSYLSNHIAIETDDFDELYKKHEEMGIVDKLHVPNKIYFIHDPEGHYMEILNKRRFEIN